MTLTLELAPEVEAQLAIKARQRGLALPDYVRQLAERDAEAAISAREEQEAKDAAMRAGAEIMAPLYAESLASGGELTAFSQQQEDLHEYTDEELQASKGVA